MNKSIKRQFLDTVDSARIAKKLGDTQREVWFALSAMEIVLGHSRSAVGFEDPSHLINSLKHREYSHLISYVEEG